MKISGPKIDPCRTPHVTSKWLVFMYSCSMYGFLYESVVLHKFHDWLYQMLSISLEILLRYIFNFIERVVYSIYKFY